MLEIQKIVFVTSPLSIYENFIFKVILFPQFTKYNEITQKKQAVLVTGVRDKNTNWYNISPLHRLEKDNLK